MEMSEYLGEIEHAASQTLSLVWSEHQQLENLDACISGFTTQIEDSASQVQWLIDNPEFDDDFQATVMHWESYFGPESDKHYSEMRKPELEALRDIRTFSRGALSGSILQYGKQGISLMHGQLACSPDGRTIANQPLKEILWQGRNQALHWEEGTLSPKVTACFENLARNIDPKFSEFATRNLAWDVLGLLEWRDFADFRRDMLSLS